MACEHEKIRCPRCQRVYKIETRQALMFCPYQTCGMYFDRNGVETDAIDYQRTGNRGFSSRPFFDGTSDLVDSLNQPSK